MYGQQEVVMRLQEFQLFEEESIQILDVSDASEEVQVVMVNVSRLMGDSSANSLRGYNSGKKLELATQEERHFDI